jgi:hypothetical protein
MMSIPLKDLGKKTFVIIPQINIENTLSNVPNISSKKNLYVNKGNDTLFIAMISGYFDGVSRALLRDKDFENLKNGTDIMSMLASGNIEKLNIHPHTYCFQCDGKKYLLFINNNEIVGYETVSITVPLPEDMAEALIAFIKNV